MKKERMKRKTFIRVIYESMICYSRGGELSDCFSLWCYLGIALGL